MSLGQLSLNVGLRDDATLESFWVGENEACVAWLKAFVSGLADKTGSYGYLFGPQASGCTHLLWSAAHLAVKEGNSAAYLSLEILKTEPKALEGLENLDLSCLDDVQAIAGNPIAEEALFHAFNRCLAERKRLLIAGNGPSNLLNIGLKDLRTRLASGVSFALKPLSLEESLKALQLRAKARGLVLPEPVGAFLLKRWQRSMRELYAVLEILDAASLSHQRPLTIPFVKRILHL